MQASRTASYCTENEGAPNEIESQSGLARIVFTEIINDAMSLGQHLYSRIAIAKGPEPIAEFCAGLEGEEKFRAQAALNACFRAAR